MRYGPVGVGIGGMNFQPSTVSHQRCVAAGSALASSVCVMTPRRSITGAAPAVDARRFRELPPAALGLADRFAAGFFLTAGFAVRCLVDALFADAFFALLFPLFRVATGPPGRERQSLMCANSSIDARDEQVEYTPADHAEWL
jgi:hypothetical protein